MSENAPKTTPYDAVPYNELRQMAAGRTLASNGSKEEIIARLVEADAAGSNAAGAGDDKKDEGSEGGNEGAAPAQEQAPVTIAPRPVTRTAPVAAPKDTETVFRTKVERIKASLATQPKMMIFIPFEHGENPEQAAKIQLHVNINGYPYDIPRGVGVEVPQQVAQMVMERLASEGKAGRNALISGNPEKETALGE